MIQRLGSDVVSELRSGVALTSFAQCVEELVLNALDAQSTCITIDIDISNVSVEVSDNGTGLLRSDMKNVGIRYFTSKCHSIKDLENANSYGFRGEALASLSKVCEKMEIISRHQTSYRTFCKLSRRGKDMGVYESTSLRSKHGTTVVANGIFHTLPVRQKLISSTVDLEQVRRRVAAIAIMHPGLSLTLRNKENGCTYLQTHRSLSTLSTISQVFGCYKSKAFKPISGIFGSCTVSGYVNLNGYQNKNFQLIYINKRMVMKTRLHKLANRILSRGINRLPEDDVISTLMPEKMVSPKYKCVDRYAGFVINLQCPHNAYDITFDPAKTLVEFENWDEPVTCLTQCLYDFLVNEGVFCDNSNCGSGGSTKYQTDPANLVVGGDNNSPPSVQKLKKDQGENTLKTGGQDDPVCKKHISASDLRWSLYSSTAKRRQETVDYDKERKCSKSCETSEDYQNQLSKQCYVNNLGNKIETSMVSNQDHEVYSDSPLNQPRSCNIETNECTSTHNLSSQDLSIVQEQAKGHGCNRSSIYTVLQKFCHKSGGRSPCRRNNNLKLNHTNKLRSDLGDKLRSSKYEVGKKKTTRMLSCGKNHKRSMLYAMRKRITNCCQVLRSSKNDSESMRCCNGGSISREEQIQLSENWVCNGIQKSKNLLKVFESWQNDTDNCDVNRSTVEVSHSKSNDHSFLEEDASRMVEDYSKSMHGSLILGHIKDPNELVDGFRTKSSDKEDASSVLDGSRAMNSLLTLDGSGMENSCWEVSDSRNMIDFKDTTPVDCSQTRNGMSVINVSQISDDSINIEGPRMVGIFRPEDGFRSLGGSRSQKDSNLCNDKLEDLSITGSTSAVNDNFRLKGGAQLDNVKMLTDCSLLACASTVSWYRTGDESSSRSKKGCGTIAGYSSVDGGRLLDDVCPENGSQTKDCYQIVHDILKNPGPAVAENNILPSVPTQETDLKVDTNARTVSNTIDNNDSASGNVHSEWLCQFDSWNRRPMYVNSRTGNTCFENPTSEGEIVKVLSQSKAPGQTGTLHPLASHLSHNFKPWLPRNGSRVLNKREYLGETGNRLTGVDVLLDSWVNPVFEGNGVAVVDASFPSASKALVKVHGMPQPFNFTKECFKGIKVIKQLDNKFIVCHYTGGGNKRDDLLMIVDQHAAHERVRLETFMKALFSSGPNESEPGKIKSLPLLSPCKIFFSDRDICLMRAFRAQLEQVGITFEEEQLSSIEQQQSVSVKTVPSVCLGREQSSVTKKMPLGIESNIEELIKEQIEVLLMTKGASMALPRTIMKVLNSQACHGAIRFGDALTLADCQDLLNSLSKCDLPFQCAHGRPSMIPLIDMKLIKKEMKKQTTKLPRVWRVKKMMTEKYEV